MNADGSNRTRLTSNGTLEWDYSPDWSPDGLQIAFLSLYQSCEIYVMDADGSGQTNLSNHASEDEAPAWSPDGSSR